MRYSPLNPYLLRPKFLPYLNHSLPVFFYDSTFNWFKHPLKTCKRGIPLIKWFVFSCKNPVNPLNTFNLILVIVKPFFEQLYSKLLQLCFIRPFQLFAKSEAFIHILDKLDLVLIPLHHFTNRYSSAVFVGYWFSKNFPVWLAQLVKL